MQRRISPMGVLSACIIATMFCLAQSQPVVEATAVEAELAVQPMLVVPEPTQPDGPRAAGAVTAGVSPANDSTTVRLRRSTRLQAAAALRQARAWRPLMGAATSRDAVDPQAICGANGLVADNRNTNCRIVTTYSNGQSTSCSAFKFGEKLLGTAGHCLYNKPNGGWATNIDVYCTGGVACNVQRTTYATQITTTPQWLASATTIPTAWDGAVIKTAAALPGPAYRLGQITKSGTYSVSFTGYPAQSGDPGCQSSAFAGACYQFTSTDTLQASSSSMFTSGNLDLCSGHSGSGVSTADSSRYIVAVVSGASFSPCANFFVPQVNSNAGVNKDCERAEGGVSFACLANKLGA